MILALAGLATLVAGWRQRLTTQLGTHARQKLGSAERLDQVIVGTGLKPVNAILGLGARGENDHRNFRTSRVAADFPKHRITIAAR